MCRDPGCAWLPCLCCGQTLGDKYNSPHYETNSDRVRYDGTKPRSLVNMMARVNSTGNGHGGSGSCWINAALQAMFTPLEFKKVFCKQWRRLRGSPLQEQLLENSSEYERLYNEGPRAPVGNEQKRLAALFHCLHEPNAEAFIPFLHADKYYRGPQEDAGEHMVVTLGNREEVPAIFPLLEGTIVQTLRCLRPECQQAHTSLEERSHALQVSLSSEDGEILYRTVQQAVDPDQSVTTRVDSDKICPHCGSQQDDWEKATQFTEVPRVLMVVSNRWMNHHSDGGLLHAVAADQIVRLRGVCYDLCATGFTWESRP